MAEETQAMIQMVSLTINGSEKIIRGSAAVVKALSKALLVVYMKTKQRLDLLPGEKTMMQFAMQGKTLQCMTLNAEQFELFKANAKKYDIQYHHINDAKGNGIDTVTLFIPESDAHKVNELVRKLNLNSIQNIGTVKAEDVNPTKAVDPKEMLASGINAAGVLSIPLVHENLLKNGIDQDKIQQILEEFIDSKEVQDFLNMGKPVDFGDFTVEPQLDIGMEPKTTPISPEAAAITDKFVPFGEETELVSSKVTITPADPSKAVGNPNEWISNVQQLAAKSAEEIAHDISKSTPNINL